MPELSGATLHSVFPRAHARRRRHDQLEVLPPRVDHRGGAGSHPFAVIMAMGPGPGPEYKRQRRNAAVTELVKMPNRGHSLTIDHGLPQVARTALDFVNRFVPAKPSQPARSGPGARAPTAGRPSRGSPARARDLSDGAGCRACHGAAPIALPGRDVLRRRSSGCRDPLCSRARGRDVLGGGDRVSVE